MLSIRQRFPSVTTFGGISRRLEAAMNRRTASVVPLIALPRTSFFCLAGAAGVCAAIRAAPPVATAIDAAVPCPTSFRKSLRFKRILASGVY